MDLAQADRDWYTDIVTEEKTTLMTLHKKRFSVDIVKIQKKKCMCEQNLINMKEYAMRRKFRNSCE